MKGQNTAAAVKRAEAVACPICDADAGDPCVVPARARNARAGVRPVLLRASKPHAARARLGLEAAVFAAGKRQLVPRIFEIEWPDDLTTAELELK